MFFTHNATCEQVARACKVCEAPHTRLAGARLEWRMTQRAKVLKFLQDPVIDDATARHLAILELTDNPY